MSKPETRPEWLAANAEVKQLAEKCQDEHGLSRVPRFAIQQVARKHGLDEQAAIDHYAPWTAA